VIPAIDLDLRSAICTFSGKISQSDPSDQGQPRGATCEKSMALSQTVAQRGTCVEHVGFLVALTSRIQQLMPSTASAMNADVA